MAAGDSTLVAAQSRTGYVGSNTDLVGKAFGKTLEISKGNSNILSQLQGPPGSGKPFIIHKDLKAKGKDTLTFNVAAALGQAGRRGLQRAVNYEEPLFHAAWNVKIDNLRVVVAWNELLRWAAVTGESWQTAYAVLCGERIGQIEQEDMLIRFRQRSGTQNTIRPGRATSLDTIKYSDTYDTAAIGRALGMLKTYVKPATVGKTSGGMDLKGYVALGPNIAMESLFSDPTFTGALSHAAIDGPMNPYWTGDLPKWRGVVMQGWDISSPDTPGAIGSSIMPQAILGDGSATSGANTINTGTAVFTIYGGGRSQASLGDAATIYKPFEYFYGCDKLLGETISTGADANVYYFLVIDPADGKWGMYSYTGSSAFALNGHSLTITQRLHSSATGAAVTTLGNVTYDSSVNKVSFPTGSHIVQCNANGVPIADTYLFGADAGAKCYGAEENTRIENKDDYGALQGKGLWSIYGCDIASDTQGLFHRSFVRLQSAYEHELGGLLPQL